jgi:hypothetical protein
MTGTDEKHLYSYLEAVFGARVSSDWKLVGAGEFHPVGSLDAGDDHGPVLHFHVRLQDGDVHELAFLRTAAIGAKVIELNVALVRGDEVLNGGVHDSAS